MKYDDDATGEPINTCIRCGNQEIGYVDDTEIEYICNVCIVLELIAIQNEKTNN